LTDLLDTYYLPVLTNITLHFLMNCDKLIHERVTLFRNISDIVPSFTTMSDVEKFMFLFTSHDLDICKVVI
jgi:hypothetical protein